MTADTLHTPQLPTRRARRWVAVVCAAVLLLLAGCKSSDKELKGAGVARGKDPLVHGPNLIPRQNMPIPDRATGKGKPDPLTSPTGRTGEKVGYTDDPERFKGTVIPGQSSTPAALAGRIKDGDELKIEDVGVPLTPAGGAPGSGLQPPEGVAPLYAQLEKLGVKREDRSLAFEGGKWVCRASVVRTAEGAKTEYVGTGATPPEAVRRVIEQLTSDRK